MRLFHFAAAVLAAAFSTSTPSMAATADPMDLFKSICLAHEGDMAGAEAAALAQGLVASTDNRGQPVADGDMEMVLHVADNPDFFVMIGPAPSEIVTVKADNVMVCAVIAPDADGKLVAAGKALALQMALPSPFKDKPNGYMVFYRKLATGLVEIPDDTAVLNQSIKAGDYRIFDVRSSGDGRPTMLSQMSAWRK